MKLFSTFQIIDVKQHQTKLCFIDIIGIWRPGLLRFGDISRSIRVLYRPTYQSPSNMILFEFRPSNIPLKAKRTIIKEIKKRHIEGTLRLNMEYFEGCFETN